MACCIVGLLILVSVRRARWVLGFRRNDISVPFAPPARRPPPGGAPSLFPEPVAEPHIAKRRPATGLFDYAALGMTIYVVAVTVLLWTGVAQNTGSPLGWIIRTGCYIALILAAVRLARSSVRSDTPRDASWMVIVIGAVFFEFGVLDMHAFGLIQIGHGDVLWDIVFHNFGPALALVGALVLLRKDVGRRATSSRSSRSISTRARPSASAVTVSSMPPRTE
jgi:hypothetical protein